MNVYEIVTKLIGPIRATGEHNGDIRRKENLRNLIDLVDSLVADISGASTARTRHEASMKAIGEKAHAFLVELRESLDDSERYLLEKVTESASDYVLGREDEEFAEKNGGEEVLYESLVSELRSYDSFKEETDCRDVSN